MEIFVCRTLCATRSISLGGIDFERRILAITAKVCIQCRRKVPEQNLPSDATRDDGIFVQSKIGVSKICRAF